MFPHLYISALLIASIELFFIGIVVGYFQEKTSLLDAVKLVLSSLGAFFFLYIGFLTGKLLTGWFGDRSSWYGATILLFLGIKMFYDRIKLGKLKQLINPLENKGLVILTLLLGINVFFVGASSSLLSTSSQLIYISLPIMVSVVLLAYVLGFKIKNLLSRRFELLSGLLYIAMAIIIASNI